MGSRASAPHLFLFSIHEHHDVGARHWSDTLPFHIAGDIAHPGHDTIDITNVERHTTIMPNSSNNTVAILSSYYPPPSHRNPRAQRHCGGRQKLQRAKPGDRCLTVPL